MKHVNAKLRLNPIDRQVIVIVGATSGIGLATARLAASRGARLVLAGRSHDALDQLVHEIGPDRAICAIADVTRQTDVDRIAAEALRAFDGFDTWVNNAAVSAYGRCLEVSTDDLRQIMETNFWGTVYGSRVACNYLRTRGGALINVGSILSDRAVPLQGMYSASKHAIKGWTDALRTELAYDEIPISVTLIKPAAIDTPYAEHAGNYLHDQPTHLPPVYSPASVAQAILYAAEHPVRDLIVGGAGKVFTAVEHASPRLMDVLLARVLLPGTHSGRPAHGRPNLYRASEDLRERGDYQGIVRRSLYTEAVTHPRLVRVALGTAAASIYALWRRRKTLRRTLRAAQYPHMP